MTYRLKDIIKRIVSTAKLPLQVEFDRKEMRLFSEYLNCWTDKSFNIEQKDLLSNIKSLSKFNSNEDKWSFIESNFGGNAIKDNCEKLGWLSLQNYIPNIVINRENLDCRFDFLLDDNLSDSVCLSLDNLNEIITEWETVLDELNKKMTKEAQDLTRIVISNWRLKKDLIKFAEKRIGYVDSNNGLGICYKKDIDFETKIKVPDHHILVFADNLTENEFAISENQYLEFLINFLKDKTSEKGIIKMKDMIINKTAYSITYT